MASAPHSDKAILTRAAVNFRNALRARIGDEVLKLANRLNPSEVDSDGWGVDVAEMGPDLPCLGIWFDHWMGGTQRRFWAGFSAPEDAPLSELIDSYLLPTGRTFTDADWIDDDRGGRLIQPLKHNEVKLPHHESFLSDSDFYFGIYDEEVPDAARFVPRAVNFAVEVISSSPVYRDFSDFRDLEGIPLEKRQLAYSRSAKLVRRFIEKRIADGKLVCDDCTFDPTDRIGRLPIGPRSLLDVHHKQPLNLTKQHWNTLTDLSLLCPICHRLTHAKMRIQAAT
jgi:hypothetical protein